MAGLACAWLVSRRPLPQIARHSLATLGYEPVFVDVTGIEVSGKRCESPARGCNEEKQYRPDSMFVGLA